MAIAPSLNDVEWEWGENGDSTATARMVVDAPDNTDVLARVEVLLALARSDNSLDWDAVEQMDNDG
jgi:hypothetical protein